MTIAERDDLYSPEKYNGPIHLVLLDVKPRRQIESQALVFHSDRSSIGFLPKTGISRKVGLRHVEQDLFLDFFAKFLAYLMIFPKFCSTFGASQFE